MTAPSTVCVTLFLADGDVISILDNTDGNELARIITHVSSTRIPASTITLNVGPDVDNGEHAAVYTDAEFAAEMETAELKGRNDARRELITKFMGHSSRYVFRPDNVVRIITQHMEEDGMTNKYASERTTSA